ncbi:MAG: hypothetical protein LH702_18600 [Phormidesmis sp. CAN_BIN44]|nr:hypothetical protein [Phormidesmis sp. CAN_BIN44]
MLTTERTEYISHIESKRTAMQSQPPTAPTCSQCIQFCNGICKTKAAADWGDSSRVKPTRSACFLAELLPS